MEIFIEIEILAKTLLIVLSIYHAKEITKMNRRILMINWLEEKETIIETHVSDGVVEGNYEVIEGGLDLREHIIFILKFLATCFFIWLLTLSLNVEIGLETIVMLHLINLLPQFSKRFFVQKYINRRESAL